MKTQYHRGDIAVFDNGEGPDYWCARTVIFQSDCNLMDVIPACRFFDDFIDGLIARDIAREIDPVDFHDLVDFCRKGI